MLWGDFIFLKIFLKIQATRWWSLKWILTKTVKWNLLSQISQFSFHSYTWSPHPCSPIFKNSGLCVALWRSPVCHIFLLCLFLPLYNTSQLPSEYISLVWGGQKKTSGRVSVFLWWSSLKPPGSNQRSGKHSCSIAKMGMNKCDNSHALLRSLSFKIWGT